MSVSYIHLLDDDKQDCSSLLQHKYPYLLVDNTSKVFNHLSKQSIEHGEALIFIAPERDLRDNENEYLIEFIDQGGSVLLALGNNTLLDIDRCQHLNSIAALAGVKIHENFNQLPRYLVDIEVHNITANIHSLGYHKSDYILKATNEKECYSIAFSQNPDYLMIASNYNNNKKVCIISNALIFKDIYSDDEENKLFGENLLSWLLNHNIYEIKNFKVPSKLLWGQDSTIGLSIQATKEFNNTTISCYLESLNAGNIDNSNQTIISLPSDIAAYKEWAIQPKVIGDQRLQLSIETIDKQKHIYKAFSALKCLANGAINVVMKNTNGEIINSIETGDTFLLYAYFQWNTDVIPSSILKFTLEFQDGFTIVEDGNNSTHSGLYDNGNWWKLKANKTGCHPITVCLHDSKQKYQSLIHINKSQTDHLIYIQKLLVIPLEAKITELLSLQDKRLVTDIVRAIPLYVLSTYDYVRNVYNDSYSVEWLFDLLNAANKESYDNDQMLGWIFDYFVPTFIPESGVYIPCNPDLASRLTQIHPENKSQLEHCLLCSNESNELQIKQKIISYITHEKFGHGFFSTHTLLGKQVVLLEKHQGEIQDKYHQYEYIVQRILDSATLIEEGFSAWLELYILTLFPTDISQSSCQRKTMLFSSSDEFSDSCDESAFFNDFPSKYKSQYLEVYEYLDYICREYGFTIAIDAVLSSTNTDYGITEVDGCINFSEFFLDPFEPNIDSHNKPAHKKLKIITDYLYDTREESKPLVKRHNRQYNISPDYYTDLFGKILAAN